jgi:hypothetical protein
MRMVEVGGGWWRMVEVVRCGMLDVDRNTLH